MTLNYSTTFAKFVKLSNRKTLYQVAATKNMWMQPWSRIAAKSFITLNCSKKASLVRRDIAVKRRQCLKQVYVSKNLLDQTFSVLIIYQRYGTFCEK